MTAQTILPANSVRGGDLVTNSCRFNAPDDAYMHKTPSSDGSRRIGTFSIWVKLALNTPEGQYLFSGSPNTTTTTSIGLSIDGDDLRFNGWTSNSQHMLLVTDRKFRDPSAWYNIVVAWDTTQGTASNRVKIYVQGVQETSFSTEIYPDQNRDLNINNASNKTLIGARPNENYAFGDGYYSEVVMIDGTALSPTSFGEFGEDSGIWKPINVSGLTFGTNGFYLDFKDSANLGNDANGGTDLTEVNLAAIDQSTDTCTNNFATMNPLNQTVSGGVFSEGNLIFTRGGNALSSVSTFAITTGKWYWEWKQLGGSTKVGIGSINTFTTKASSNAGTAVVTNAGGAHTGGLNTYAYSKNGKSFSQTKDGNNSGVSYGDTWTTNDIIGCAFDATNGTIWFSKNGTWQDSATISEIQNGTTTNAAYSSIASDTFYVIQDGEEAAGVPHSIAVNFGSPPFAISSGNTDGDGYGNFEYAVPSGYFSLNTKNLAEYG